MIRGPAYLRIEGFEPQPFIGSRCLQKACTMVWGQYHEALVGWLLNVPATC